MSCSFDLLHGLLHDGKPFLLHTLDHNYSDIQGKYPIYPKYWNAGKFQSMFSWENTNIISVLSAELAQVMLRVTQITKQ